MMTLLIHGCSSCLAPLNVEDGHTLCLLCLGIGHLRQALTENVCFNCIPMLLVKRSARLATGKMPAGTLASSWPKVPERHKCSHNEAPTAKRKIMMMCIPLRLTCWPLNLLRLNLCCLVCSLVLLYLDDWLVCTPSWEQTLSNTSNLLDHVTQL